MTNTTLRYTLQIWRTTAPCKTGSIRRRRQRLQNWRNQRKRWHAFGRHYPLRSERSKNTVYGFQQRIWRILTWLLMYWQNIMAQALGCPGWKTQASSPDAKLRRIDRLLGNAYTKSSFTVRIWEFRWRIYVRPVYRWLNVWNLSCKTNR